MTPSAHDKEEDTTADNRGEHHAPRVRQKKSAPPSQPPVYTGVCSECQQEFTYAGVAEWLRLHETGCCSERCAILTTLSSIWALDRSALVPLLRTGDRDTRFMLEDVLKRLQRSGLLPRYTTMVFGLGSSLRSR